MPNTAPPQRSDTETLQAVLAQVPRGQQEVLLLRFVDDLPLQEIAVALGVPLLGETPIDPKLRQACDDGRPLTATDPDGPTGQVFLNIARQLA